jgi:hypothetical protein
MREKRGYSLEVNFEKQILSDIKPKSVFGSTNFERQLVNKDAQGNRNIHSPETCLASAMESFST